MARNYLEQVRVNRTPHSPPQRRTEGCVSRHGVVRWPRRRHRHDELLARCWPALLEEVVCK